MNKYIWKNLTLVVANGTATPRGEIVTRKRERLALSAKMEEFMYQKSVT